MIGRIADYELLEKIGEGAMGAVFKGRNLRLDTVVAIKILFDEFARDPEYRERFLREARAEASLHHTNIAACFDVGQARLEPPDLLSPGSPGPHPEHALYLVMEYVPGTDLHEVVGDRPLEILKVLDLAIQIAAGLECAHAGHVVHRDLKSTNIRVTPDGQLKIVDFGLSRIERAKEATRPPSLTSQGRVIGTVQFMSPEQTRGRTIDPRSDLFSLGVILYHLVTGRLPFTGGTAFEVANAIAAEEPPPLARYASHVPEELERVVRKLLAKDAEQRYQSAHEVRTDLERLQKGLPPPKPRLEPWQVAALVGVATLVVVVGGWLIFQLIRPPRLGIAVMPFENRTGDPSLDYLGDGIAASLVGDLVRGARFNVASLTETRSLDPDKRSAGAVGRELGVRAVVEGSLLRESGITFVDVQLTEGHRGFVLWTNRFPYVADDAAGIEREIVRQVVGKIDPWRLRRPNPGPRPRSPSAYDLYLRGNALLDDPGEPRGPDKALEQYARALDMDRDFALAWAGESMALLKIWNRDKTQESIHRAEEAANRSIHLNPELLEAKLARAQIFRATSRHADSIREIKEVLKVNPGWTDAMLQLTASYRDSGDMEKAVANQLRAVELQPEYWRNWHSLGNLYFRLAQYDPAAAAARKVIGLVPKKNIGYELLAAIETKRGDFAAAMAAYQQLPSPVTNGMRASNIGTAFYFEGKLDEARRYYELAVRLEPRNHNWRWYLGDLHQREGKADSAQADYARAVSLIDDQLHVDPRNAKLKLDRALLLAKRGQCDAGEAALAEIAGELPPTDAECALRIAKLDAICGRSAEAIAGIRKAIDQGASPAYLGKQDEFQGLAGDPAYRALMGTKH